MKKYMKFGCLGLLLVSLIALLAIPAFASGPLDEITDYEITVTPNDDGTLTMLYHIEWKVLDSSSEGPLEWVKVGIPNSHYVSVEGKTDTVAKIGVHTSSDIYARIDLDRAYYAGETVVFEFLLVQDYLYEVDKLTEGETVYEFTPGWFDEIDVDRLVIRWNADKAVSWSPSCEIVDGYLTWSSNLNAGTRYNISVTYPNDAYGFDLSKTIVNGEDETTLGDVLIPLVTLLIITSPILFAIGQAAAGKKSYQDGSGLGTDKITRTRIEYWPVCQGCGAPREDGKDNCTYCGRSFIKSKEVITEEKLKAEDKAAAAYTKDGTYRYTSNPNVYVHVHVTPRPTPPRSTPSCAHSSCACACACACAGGGRAGCSTKDFYNTGLKLSQLEKYKPAEKDKR